MQSSKFALPCFLGLGSLARHWKAPRVRTVALAAVGLAAAATWVWLAPLSRPAVAAMPQAMPRIVVIYHAVPNLLAWTAGAGEHVATTQEAFDALLNQYKTDPNFVGTVIITDNPNPPGTWPPVCQGKVHLRFRFRDVPYYNNTWEPMLAIGWVPGFLQQQEAVPAPTIDETLYDYDIWTRIDAGHANLAETRVRKSDGAIGVVSAQTVLAACAIPGARSEVVGDPCDAGPFWPVCCKVQQNICRSGAWIIGCLFNFQRCIDCMGSGMLQDACNSCAQDCEDCVVPNPCHSCGNCGLSWLLCRWFGNC